MPLVTLITGASSGFGNILAYQLAHAGHQVYATMRDSAGRNAQAAAELSQVPGVRVVELDVASESSVTAAVGPILRKAGRIDVTVNNAGFGTFGIAEAFTVEQWETVFATNLFGAIRVNRAVLPSMRERGAGLLVHVTSTAGRLPAPYLGPYCATKWALEAYAEVLRIELASTGVDSVVVEPGKYSTPIFGKGFPAADDSRAAAYGAADHSKRFFDIFMTEMQALAQDPAEVASAIARLIETPAGRRPFRTLVGRDAEELEPYNAAAEQIRDSVAQKYGLPSGIVPHQRALGAD